MAATEISLPADITEIQFPKELPALRVALQDAAPTSATEASQPYFLPMIFPLLR
ncbi:hypothetical protein Q5H92_01835 [Hymenobacter sp. M29]|uniref:Uncharacterized protein n=1 Tax=Hymenobacter mellowenesis TaxID=3063995 RepID=A0ABT9A5I0_9BACT|nr:hypothetical protein [Hymenobacter sp. M29]MDO7845080.1 hypothetical protein [Hymenobacter sp. M29]